MSVFDYDAARQVHSARWPFYALIMSAMLQADTTNQAKLQAAFPDVWAELAARDNAPGGLLDGEAGT